jgi:hypothetical protein
MGLKDIGFLNIGLDRKNAVRVIAAVIALFVALWAGYAFVAKYSSVKKLAAVKGADLERFSRLESVYLGTRAAFDLRAQKAYASAGGRSFVAVVEEIGEMAGVGDRVTSLKSVGEEDRLGYRVRSVEVKIERIGLNRLVNLLYMIEENRLLLVINEFTVKSRFDDPKLVDVRLKLSHLSKSPA